MALRFFEYVEFGTQALVDAALGRGLPMQFCQNPMSRQKVAFKEELARASLSARRLYGGADIPAEEMPLFQSAPSPVASEEGAAAPARKK